MGADEVNKLMGEDEGEQVNMPQGIHPCMHEDA